MLGVGSSVLDDHAISKVSSGTMTLFGPCGKPSIFLKLDMIEKDIGNYWPTQVSVDFTTNPISNLLHVDFH